jgi:hypothetical protein
MIDDAPVYGQSGMCDKDLYIRRQLMFWNMGREIQNPASKKIRVLTKPGSY